MKVNFKKAHELTKKLIKEFQSNDNISYRATFTLVCRYLANGGQKMKTFEKNGYKVSIKKINENDDFEGLIEAKGYIFYFYKYNFRTGVFYTTEKTPDGNNLLKLNVSFHKEMKQLKEKKEELIKNTDPQYIEYNDYNTENGINFKRKTIKLESINIDGTIFEFYPNEKTNIKQIPEKEITKGEAYRLWEINLPDNE